MGVTLTLVLVAAFLAWLLAPGLTGRRSPGDPVEPVDAEELEAAEREVGDLGGGRRPEDGFEGDDWGPGAGGPKAE